METTLSPINQSRALHQNSKHCYWFVVVYLKMTIQFLEDESAGRSRMMVEYRKRRQDRLCKKEEMARKLEIINSFVEYEQIKKLRSWVHQSRSDEEIVISKFAIDLTAKDLKTLKSTSWLNDEVINFYLNLLKEEPTRKRPRVHVFSTFFYPKLKQRGYDSVKASTRRLNPPLTSSLSISDLNNSDECPYDLILVPIHLGMHWCMSAIDIVKRRITYYDSLGGSGEECCSILFDWLQRECLERNTCGGGLRVDEWKLYPSPKIPQQKNGYDCGVFSILYAAFLSRGVDISKDLFHQNDIKKWRERISVEIIEGSLIR